MLRPSHWEILRAQPLCHYLTACTIQGVYRAYNCAFDFAWPLWLRYYFHLADSDAATTSCSNTSGSTTTCQLTTNSPTSLCPTGNTSRGFSSNNTDFPKLRRFDLELQQFSSLLLNMTLTTYATRATITTNSPPAQFRGCVVCIIAQLAQLCHLLTIILTQTRQRAKPQVSASGFPEHHHTQCDGCDRPRAGA